MKSILAGIVAAILSFFGIHSPGGHQAVVPLTTQAAAAAVTQQIATTTNATTTGTAASSTADGGNATTTVINNYITRPVIERIVSTTTSGVTEAELTTKLNQLDNKLTSLIYSWTGSQGGSPSSPVSNSIAAGGVWNAIAGSQKIDNLSGVTISNSTIDAASIPDLSGSYLSLNGGTVSGNLTVTGTFSGGNLSLSNASTSKLSVFNNAYFGGTATSTFTSAGWLGIGTTSPAYALDVNGTIQASDVISKGPTVDVRAFGATGDGTTDDADAIQAAVDSLPARGGTIFFSSWCVLCQQNN